MYTGQYFVFGMSTEIANKRISEMDKEFLNHIESLGIHFHRKTQNVSEWSFKEELQEILTPETLEKISIMNVGGGLPVSYKNTNENVLPAIMKKLKELKLWLSENNIKLILEPGRYLAGPCVELQTKIISVDNNNITVDASVYNAAMDSIIANIKLKVKGEKDVGITSISSHSSEKPYVIKGCTPCSRDMFRYKVFLNNPKVGDVLTFENAGAYNFSTDF